MELNATGFRVNASSEIPNHSQKQQSPGLKLMDAGPFLRQEGRFPVAAAAPARAIHGARPRAPSPHFAGLYSREYVSAGVQSRASGSSHLTVWVSSVIKQLRHAE